MIPETVNQPELAALLGISTRHLRTLNETVFKPKGEGKGLRYHLADSIRAYIEHRASFSTGGAARPTETKGHALSARERLDLAKAEQAEYDLALKRKELVLISDAENAWANLVVPARLELLAIEPRLRLEIGNDHAALVGVEVKRCLRNLGAVGAEDDS